MIFFLNLQHLNTQFSCKHIKFNMIKAQSVNAHGFVFLHFDEPKPIEFKISKTRNHQKFTCNSGL